MMRFVIESTSVCRRSIFVVNKDNSLPYRSAFSYFHHTLPPVLFEVNLASKASVPSASSIVRVLRNDGAICGTGCEQQG